MSLAEIFSSRSSSLEPGEVLVVLHESEAAFYRAFKRKFGEPPACYRNEHRTPNSTRQPIAHS
jgi:hypothetical protein